MKRGFEEMGKLLDRLGTSCYRLKWWVLGSWLAILLVAGSAAAVFYEVPGSAISIPGTEAQAALDHMSKLFPDWGKSSGNIVLRSNGDEPVSAFKSRIDDALSQVRAVAGVVMVVSPFDNPLALSSDGKTAYALVQLRDETGEIDTATLDRIAGITSRLSTRGLQVERGGALVDMGLGDILGVTELFGVLLALVILVMMLGASIAAGMPLLIAALGVGVSIAGLFALGRTIALTSLTPVLSVMLGLAVGIDYSLFIVSKYRSLLLEGYSHRAAAGRAIGTAGNAVVFAAATVVIALAALSVVGIPFLTTMGLAGAVTIALMAVVAITLTPALFGIAGTRIFGRRTREAIAVAQAAGPIRAGEAREAGRPSVWQRWGRALTRRPVVALLLPVIVVGVLAIPVPNIQLGLPSDQYAEPSTTQRKAYDLVADAFGVGYNTPLVAVVSGVPPVTDEDRAAVRSAATAEFEKRMAAQELSGQWKQLAEQLAQTQLEAQIARYSSLAELGRIAMHLATVAGVQSAIPAGVTPDGASGIIQIIPRSAPYDQATTDLISYLRSNEAAAAGNPQVRLAITGATPLQLDISKKLSDALPLYLIVVVGLSLVLLMVAFRSVLVPVTATLGFLLSVLAMFGSMVAVFQQGLFGIVSPSPLISFLPIIGIGVLFGLAMDYQFFMASGIHEAYTRSGNPRQGIEIGFSHGARVVAAAATIMIAVFAGFVGHHFAAVQMIALGLAAGIFVDAFLVRMTLIPAAMTLLGRSAWWLPRWLDRVLPHMTIEGEEEEEEEPVEEAPAMDASETAKAARSTTARRKQAGGVQM